jgi:hypothetical protein
MATNEVFDWRRADRRLYGAAAVVFVVVVLAGFGRTYYLSSVLGGPPVPSLLVHLHGIVMAAWVLLFVGQVWLIRTKRARTHMTLGAAGAVLAALVIVVGFFTAAAAAKFGSASAPPAFHPLSFMVVPMTDILMFAGLFGAAFYYRRQPASHKRLMLLTAVNFLPPALARFPFDWVQNAGPLFFFGVPTLIAIGFLVMDRLQTGRINRPYLVGAAVLIASYPLRIAVGMSDAWMSFAGWLTTWAA